MSHAHHPEPKPGDLLYESFYSGAIGGAVVALFFLVNDSLGGRPFFTPSLLGGILFGTGGSDAAGPDLTAVALLTAVHFGMFAVFGAVATRVVRAVEGRTGGSPILPGVVLFVLLEGSFLVATSILMPGMHGQLGHGTVLLANILASAAMSMFLREAHCSAESEGDGSRGEDGVRAELEVYDQCQNALPAPPPDT